MGCGSDNIILGLPWLKKINPRIDWVTETVTIPKRSDQTEALNYKTGITQRTTYTKPTYHEMLPYEYEREKPEYPDETFIKMIRGEGNLIPKFKKKGKEFIPSIRKTTIATELAKNTPKQKLFFQKDTGNSHRYSRKKKHIDSPPPEHATTK